MEEGLLESGQTLRLGTSTLSRKKESSKCPMQSLSLLYMRIVSIVLTADLKKERVGFT